MAEVQLIRELSLAEQQCLHCALPECDENDPRCMYRQMLAKKQREPRYEAEYARLEMELRPDARLWFWYAERREATRAQRALYQWATRREWDVRTRRVARENGWWVEVWRGKGKT